MTREKLIENLKWLYNKRGGDPEANHADADKWLLEYINDPEVTNAFNAIEKWYA